MKLLAVLQNQNLISTLKLTVRLVHKIINQVKFLTIIKN